MRLFISNGDIGIYQINAKLAVPMLMLVSIFDSAWKPFFLSHFDDEDAKPLFSRVLTYYTLVASLLWLAVSLFIDYIVRIPLWNGKYFIHPNYWNGIGVVSLIMLGYLINGVTTNFAAVFHIEKKTKYLPMAIGISAVVSIVLNFILIPKMGASGGAYSLVIGYAIGAILMKILQKKVEYKIKYEWKRILIIAITSIIILIIGQIITIEVPLFSAFFIKIGLFVCYLFALKILGFFTKGEINMLKKVFRKK
jgi:O-antigen/teichoic acid export membrane protein